MNGGSFLLFRDMLSHARSVEGSLWDHIPLAGLGGSPTFPYREAIHEKAVRVRSET